jgi:hypothetical protein
MIDKTWKNEKIDKKANVLWAKEYRLINWFWIDIFARAIKENLWVVWWVTWTNNWTWTTGEPVPPIITTPQWQLWWHCLYFSWYWVDEKWRYLLTPNSWWNLGWLQKIREEWFSNDNRWMFNPWTIVDKINEEPMLFKKIKNWSSVYMVNEESKTRTMIVDMPTLLVFWWVFIEVDNLDWYKDAWTLVWTERIIN